MKLGGPFTSVSNLKNYNFNTQYFTGLETASAKVSGEFNLNTLKLNGILNVDSLTIGNWKFTKETNDKIIVSIKE